MNLQNTITMLACGNIEEVNEYYHNFTLNWIAENPVRHKFINSFDPRARKMLIASLATSFRKMDETAHGKRAKERRLWDEAYQAWDLE